MVAMNGVRDTHLLTPPSSIPEVRGGWWWMSVGLYKATFYIRGTRMVAGYIHFYTSLTFLTFFIRHGNIFNIVRVDV